MDIYIAVIIVYTFVATRGAREVDEIGGKNTVGREKGQSRNWEERREMPLLFKVV